MAYSSLSRETMKAVIEGKCTGDLDRIPMLYHFWCTPETFTKQNKIEEGRALLNKYPFDAVILGVALPDVFKAPDNDPNYRWVKKDPPQSDVAVGLDSIVAIDDWDELDDVLASFPDPEYVDLLPYNPPEDGRYRLATFWHGLFERLWFLRGMENALTDFYLYPDEIHRLFDRLTEFYCRIMERARNEVNADGMFTSDDIGTQAGPFFSPEVFDEFFMPYYKRLFDKAHELGMHFWLHTCGNIESFIPKFIDIGLDVLHPIQKYTMNEVDIAQKYGDKICIWAGFDVQQIIPYGTPEDVRAEVRYMIDAYALREGRLVLTLGNGATQDTPFASAEALLEESYNYGKEKMTELNA